LQSGVLPDARQHSGTDFRIIMKREYEVGPTGTLWNPMRAAGLPLNAPAIAQQRR
jgi:hypothetical protein